jgi:hypothetical protein
MLNTPEYHIISLIPWNGAWAAYFLADDSVVRQVSGLTPNFSLAGAVAASASGIPSERCLKLFSRITNAKIVPSTGRKDAPPRMVKLKDEFAFDDHNFYTPGFWAEKLQEHLKCRDFGAAVSKILNGEEQLSVRDPAKMLRDWSMQVISNLLPLEGKRVSIRYIETALADLSWKKWLVLPSGQLVWMTSGRNENLPVSKAIIWKYIHEATHLLHLQDFPDAGCLSDPCWRLQMEAVAMAVEFKLLNYLEAGGELPLFSGAALNNHNLIAVLLYGLFERSVRFEYDILMLREPATIDNWLSEFQQDYNLPDSFFDFIPEFAGLPGFMSCYLTGMIGFMRHTDQLRLLNGSINLFSHEEIK